MNERALWRGKRIDTGDWIVGNLLGETEILIINKITKEITGFEIDPSTLGQCTGLKDKNDNRIFEGDILNFHNQEKSKDIKLFVEWNKHLYGYFASDDLTGKHEGEPLYMCIAAFSREGYIEIIGNIHEHSELLKGAGEQNG